MLIIIIIIMHDMHHYKLTHLPYTMSNCLDMATGAKGTHEKEQKNVVHQNAIWRETVNKEQHNQKLYTEFNYNPYKKPITVAGKPNETPSKTQEKGDEVFLDVYKKSQQTPNEKFEHPMTEAQEIGWYHSMRMDKDARADSRLHLFLRDY